MKLQDIVKEIVKNKKAFVLKESIQQSELKPIVKDILHQYVKNINEVRRGSKYDSHQQATNDIRSYISPAIQNLLKGPLYGSNLSKEQIKGAELWLADYTSLLLNQVSGVSFDSSDITP
jgi:hypothetical protein